MAHEYIHLMREQEIDSKLFNDVIRIADAAFKFYSETDRHKHAHDLTLDLMRPYPRQDVIRGAWVYFRHDPSEFKAFICEYLQPCKARTMVGIHEEVDWRRLSMHDGVVWSEAPWYGTKYIIRKMDERILDTPTVEDAELHGLRLPRSNMFAPENVDVLPALTQVSVPFLKVD